MWLDCKSSGSFPFHLFNFIVSLASFCFRPRVDGMTFACLCPLFDFLQRNEVSYIFAVEARYPHIGMRVWIHRNGDVTVRRSFNCLMAATLFFWCPGILSWLDKWHLLLSHGRHHSARSDPKGWESGRCGSCGTGNIRKRASGGRLGFFFFTTQRDLHAAWFSEPLFTTQAPQVLALDSAPVEVSGGSQVQKMSSRSCK